MSPSQLLRNWMEHVWNRRETEFIHRHMTNPCAVAGLPESASTPDGFAAFRDGLIAAIPDMRIEVETAVESGPQVAGTCRVTGIHAGSRKPVDFHFGFTATVEDDKITAARNVVDFLTMLEQIDAIDHDTLQKCLTP